MTKRIFISVCLVAIVVFGTSMVLGIGALYSWLSDIQQAQLKMQLDLAAQGVNHEGIAYLQNLTIRDYRMTWIDSTGDVLYDSQLDGGSLDNHSEREEIIAARATGYGESRRYSKTLMTHLLYTAKLLEDGTILRLSIAQSSILTLMRDMLPLMMGIGLMAIALSILLAIRLSKKIIEPLNTIDLDNPLSGEGYDELAPFLRRIDSQQKQLKTQKIALEQKQSELNTIIDSMNEGMILLNEKGKILSINAAAMRLLGIDCDCQGTDLLTVCRNLDLQGIVSQALQGKHDVQIVALSAGQYQIDANPILAEGQTLGAALCFFDVTEKEKAEQMRREFTANVSHELKTPLHVISGYAELLQNGLVGEADIIPFAQKIYGESQRMAKLVEDIITLSRLDEGAKDMPYEAVDLYELAQQAVHSLESEAHTAHVALQLVGTSAPLYGILPLLYSIIYNLCDNAIKYNRAGGKIVVEVKNEQTMIILIVSDTGIGIAKDQEDRIFERFYRVDKSRSKAVGGTGLGLSIVKHAVLIHKAKIEITSSLGQGTIVTVRFPKAI